MSGLSRTPGKRVWVYPHRGFESRPLRQKYLKINNLAYFSDSDPYKNPQYIVDWVSS